MTYPEITFPIDDPVFQARMKAHEQTGKLNEEIGALRYTVGKLTRELEAAKEANAQLVRRMQGHAAEYQQEIDDLRRQLRNR